MPLDTPLFHENVAAPVAVRVTNSSLQTVLFVAFEDAVIVGTVFTTTETELLNALVHPDEGEVHWFMFRKFKPGSTDVGVPTSLSTESNEGPE